MTSTRVEKRSGDLGRDPVGCAQALGRQLDEELRCLMEEERKVLSAENLAGPDDNDYYRDRNGTKEIRVGENVLTAVDRAILAEVLEADASGGICARDLAPLVGASGGKSIGPRLVSLTKRGLLWGERYTDGLMTWFITSDGQDIVYALTDDAFCCWCSRSATVEYARANWAYGGDGQGGLGWCCDGTTDLRDENTDIEIVNRKGSSDG